ncbi:hypothetical protein BJF83_12575 [Nocardiopsis sp. CNR-923]|uniref:hypothetical protein n=1 Tax=Nocardiopsis sp. CNR-923 TaxID=1904965 RepID=UPI00095BF001|nr:hypothetical protein [Nocardiopsis sp. CNR-923]OLT29282.1 hypothetical protein BJF83_12575 [Nocardiopsis sp. CNR-923]
MIALAVLFSTVLAGAVAVGVLAARALGRARVLSAAVSRVAGGHQASGTDPERVNRGGTGT